MSDSRCKGCGARIVWGVTEEGKRIPLDPKPPCYDTMRMEDGRIMAKRARGVMVTHFATCSHANDFSKGKKNAEPENHL